jgi:hypothetical protein
MAKKSIAATLLASCLALLLGCGDSGSSDQIVTDETVCGERRSVSPAAKIVGGSECPSPNGTVVKLVLFDEEDNQSICSGVRLNGTTVLTAAHCLNEFVFSVLVELPSGRRLAPTNIALHPEVANLGALFVNDVALLTMSPPEGEPPPPRVWMAKKVSSEDTLTILGYGATDGTSSVGSGALRIGKMQANEVTNDHIFSDFTPPTLSNTCFGDSGGPAFVEDEDGGLLLAGITSTGTNVLCAAGDRSAFTNLTNEEMRRFIEASM